MIEVLHPHLAAIVTRHSKERHYLGIPVLPCYDKRRPFEFLLQRFNLSKKTPFPSIVDHARKSKVPTKLLINYADFAIKTRSSWDPFPGDVFIHVHGIDFQLEARSDSFPYKTIRTPAYKEAFLDLSTRATLIANSEATRKYLIKEGVKDSQIVTKYFGCPMPEHRPEPRTLPLKTDFKLLYLGRLIDFKGPDMTIQAFDLACELGFEGCLTIAGDGSLRQACELIARRSKYKDRISFAGEVNASQAKELYQSHDAFITHNQTGPLTLRDEAFGVTFIEAMSYGLPVLSTLSGAISESVIDRETGFLCEPLDIAQQAKNILNLSQNKEQYRKFSIAASERIKNHFSLEMEKQQLFDILNLKN